MCRSGSESNRDFTNLPFNDVIWVNSDIRVFHRVIDTFASVIEQVLRRRMEEQFETKSGFLNLSASSQNSTRLMVVAYSHVCEPFVIFHRDSRLSSNKPVALLRLKDCVVRESGSLAFSVSPKGERIGNGAGVLEFTAESQEERDSWIHVLDCRVEGKRNRIKRHQLPAIQEISEETESRRPSLITAWKQGHFELRNDDEWTSTLTE